MTGRLTCQACLQRGEMPVVAVQMETSERELLDQWLAAWNDLIDFEVVPVITSPEAAALVADRL